MDPKASAFQETPGLPAAGRAPRPGTHHYLEGAFAGWSLSSWGGSQGSKDLEFLSFFPWPGLPGGCTHKRLESAMVHAGHVLGQARGAGGEGRSHTHRAKVPEADWQILRLKYSYFYNLSCGVVVSWAKGMFSGFPSDPWRHRDPRGCFSTSLVPELYVNRPTMSVAPHLGRAVVSVVGGSPREAGQPGEAARSLAPTAPALCSPALPSLLLSPWSTSAAPSGSLSGAFIFRGDFLTWLQTCSPFC